ncbi:MAG: sigma 54-interacting transcriptional regulator [Bryobacteraceae bacterium]
MSAPKLIAIDGPLRGRVFPLEPGESFIGRGTDNDIVLPDSAASRRHCCFALRPDGCCVIRDLQSHNGTFVNGLPVAEQLLTANDEIRICRSRFVLEFGGSTDGESELHLEEDEAAGRTVVQLRREESVYLKPEQALAMTSAAGSVARAFRALLRISGAVHSTEGLRALSHRSLASIFEAVPAGRGAVLLSPPTAFAWARDTGPSADFTANRTVLDRVRRDGVALLSNSGLLSVLAVPLVSRAQVIDVLCLESTDPRVRFDEDQLQLATATGFIASNALAAALEFERLRTENRQLRAETVWRHEMVGESAAACELYRLIARVSPADSTVLITGETGTGKELVARALHQNGTRSQGPFVAINCAAIAENLLESELFGHEKGAFTGAHVQKKGKLEIAHGGTLFLDEIGELAPALQAKLLRVLQEREFERVGGTAVVKANVRVIAASNRDLPEQIRKGVFREDLYYRLNVVSIRVPPLRERREDIALLARHFIARFRRRSPSSVRDISPEALACLERYFWPGNIRELENAIERTMVLAATDIILPEDLPEAIQDVAAAATPDGSFQSALKLQKRQMILDALRASGGNFTEAARGLGVHPNSLHRMIRNLDLRDEIGRAGGVTP